MDLWTAIGEARLKLRDPHRLRENVDYALICKYGEVHVLCNAGYMQTVVAVFKEVGITLTSLHTF